MNEDEYANGITAEDLRLFLEFWPQFSTEADEAHQEFVEIKNIFFTKDTEPFSWCHLYERPIKQHIAEANLEIVQAFSAILQPEQVIDWYKQVADTPGQIGAVPDVIDQIGNHFDAIELNNENANELVPATARLSGLGLSIRNTLRCVLYHGCFLNDLVERIRTGDDKALFDAIRIDPTIIGCLSAMHRISKATLLKDEEFLDRLKNAINGTMVKREQDNFQKMRLVFEVLHEAGASRLKDKQLHQLFVEELDLYTANEAGGGNAKALRKFADTYMKKNTTT